MKVQVQIISAKYFGEYKIELIFSDGKINIFDFKQLVMRNHEESIPYRDFEKFKTFRIVNNTLVWGDDWDMILPFYTIYNTSEF